MLKTAIVGCGKIADAHAFQVGKVPGCEIVAVCDNEPLMAQQLAERYPVKRAFSNLTQMLAEARPDVVHVCTPPGSHYPIATECLNAGCHVYVEKPFTLDAAQAHKLIALAIEKGCKITAGHDDQFTHVARRMRTLVQSGYLGDGPVHMESYYCYEMGRTGYAGAILADKNHWVRRLPGKLLHNIISHGVARIAEFMTSDRPEIITRGFVSPSLKEIGETEIIDELRVIICEDESRTAYFTFSSQMRPSLHQFRMYGTKNGLVLDQDKETLIRLPGAGLKSYAEKFVPPVQFAAQYLGNLRTNFSKFLHRDFHMKSGMQYLMEEFYRSIAEGTPLPISYREILLTATIMDDIFNQLNAKSSREESSREPAMQAVSSD